MQLVSKDECLNTVLGILIGGIVKKYLIFLVIALLLFGCTSGGQQQAPPQTSNQTSPKPVTPPSKSSPFPMKFNYTMQEGDQNVSVVYWLESEKNCSGRDAVLGVVIIQQANVGAFAKFTLYLDRGELVASRWQKESDLAFDTAEPQASDMDFLLFMNYIFNAAGKNFADDPVWNSSEPTLLNEVYAFGSVSNISVANIGESTSGIFPCTEFSVAVKGSMGSAEQYDVCVANITDSNPLLYVVYVKPSGGMMGPAWNLESIEKVKSGIVVYPRCLSPVICPKVNAPTMNNLSTCNLQNGTIQPIRNDQNCVTAYTCMTMQQRAEEQIRKSQAPNCPVSQQLINEVVACWMQRKGAIFSNDNSGCITAVACQ